MLAPLRGLIRFLPVALCLGCPSEVAHAPPPESRAKAASDPGQDPRVSEYDGSYYAQETLEGSLAQPAAAAQDRVPGSGLPDESNGRCRLYSPELPEPQCCDAQYGFDVEETRKHCRLGVYLGESFHMSCGYYFEPGEDAPRWFRLSFVAGNTPRDAALAHDRQLRKVTGDASFASKPVPSVPGSYWSRHDGLNWAFLPGWPKVRLFTWRDQACDGEAVVEVLRGLVAAPEPHPDAARPLIPARQG